MSLLLKLHIMYSYIPLVPVPARRRNRPRHLPPLVVMSVGGALLPSSIRRPVSLFFPSVMV